MVFLEYDFFQNAILGSIGISIICAIIGTYLVTRRLVIFGGGISHASLGGVGLGAYLGISPILGATFFSLLSAYSMYFISRKKVRDDSMIAILWTFGMSIGLIFAYLTPHFTHALSTYLFGNILLISFNEVRYIFFLTFICIFFYLFFRPSIITISYDKDFAISQKINVTTIELCMLSLITFTIIACLQLAGILLVIAMLSIPQQTASLFTNNYTKIIIYSAIICFIGILMGLTLSYHLNIPCGPIIILSYIVLHFISKLFNFIIRK